MKIQRSLRIKDYQAKLSGMLSTRDLLNYASKRDLIKINPIKRISLGFKMIEIGVIIETVATIKNVVTENVRMTVTDVIQIKNPIDRDLN